jgi:hypothetical protein
MALVYRKRATDHNQSEIAKALQLCGYEVVDLSSQGCGCPDLLIHRQGRTSFVEVKNLAGRGRRFTPDQIAFHKRTTIPVFVLTSVNDVESLINGHIAAVNQTHGRRHP